MIVGLSLVSSVLIVWLYVGRNIVSRLTGIGAGMAGIAAGQRDVVVNTAGVDEIAAMGRTVEIFRQHAIERDALLVERAEAAMRLEGLVEERTVELQRRYGELQAAQANLIAAYHRTRNYQEVATLAARFLTEHPQTTAIRLCLA